MKTKILFFTLLLLIHTAIIVRAQKPVYPKPNSGDQVPFGKKMPLPVLDPRAEMMRKAHDSKKMDLPYTSFDTVSKQFIVHTPGPKIAPYPASGSFNTNITGATTNKTQGTSLAIHLTKDINSLSESFPRNEPANSHYSFAVLNNISYFFAEDGIHGRELWRSDGTPAGTYLVKDINPGVAGSEGGGIIAANGLLFFSAATPDNGLEPWVSDGTESGTHLLADVNTGNFSSNPNQFVDVNGAVYFVASLYSTNHQLWKTDGTGAGTALVKDIQEAGFGYNIFELTAVNDLAYFVAYTWYSGYQLFKSDGTDLGTYVVKEIGYNYYDRIAPMQLTSYNNQLFFSADDGTGRKLWTSDGTYDGTNYATGNNDILMQVDYVDIYNNRPFRILNNVLYIAGYTDANGGGLYKYNASDNLGEVLVKDLTDTPDFPYDNVLDFVVAVDITVVNDILYFKVISNINGLHDELWRTDGSPNNTQLVKTIGPGDSGVYTYNFYNGNGTLYFVVNNAPLLGNELWKSDGTDAGTVLVRDINSGTGASYPDDLTSCNGKLLFRATNNNTGSELWSSNGTEAGTSLVKDINTTTTNSSYAGSTYFFKGIGASANGVVFNAITNALGAELYKSDGTSAGTGLLNDINPGENWSYPNNFIFKNNVNYFINDNAFGTSLYKTNGTTAGLQRITAYINSAVYYVVNYNVADNGLAFYTLGYRASGLQELWRSDGTDAGTYMLSSGLSYYYNNYVAIVGNTAFFIAGDFIYGYELWKSDGTLAGTKMVKDINPGFGGSDPYNLFVYKKEVYFGAYDGGLNFALWKSDGTEKGTIKLKSITPASYNSYFNIEPQHVFCVSNNTLYFTATDFNEFGAELWKTNGTAAGTTLVKDINPHSSSNPNNLTDVKGTLYFTADDGIHGDEIWKSTGTSQGTQMVKDITPDYNYFYNYNLCSAGGKLYFLNPGTYPNILWSSDGTAANTNPVTDAGLNGLLSIENLTGVGDKLFFGAYSQKYGAELYEGDATAGTFAPVTLAATAASDIKINSAFDAILYPNPTHSTSSLQIKGNAKDVNVTITDMAGRVVWKTSENNNSQIKLPVEKFAAGQYILTVKSGADKKTLKLVKE